MTTGVGSGRTFLGIFNSPTWNTPVGHKDLDISCTSWVIADFFLNFVAVLMGVGRGRICLASFNSPTPQKTLLYAKISGISLV